MLIKLRGYILGWLLLPIGLSAQTGAKLPLDEARRLNLEDHFFEAEKQKLLGNSESEEKELLRCLEIYPKHAASLYMLGCLYTQRKEYIRAIEHIRLAVQYDPNNKWYWEKLTDLYKAQRNLPMLAETYERMTQTFPKERAFYLNASAFYSASGKSGKALGILKKCEQTNGISEDLSVEMEKIYLSLKQSGKALRQLKKLQESDPDNTHYMGLLADLYIDLGKETDGVQLYQKILKMDPANGLAHFAMSEYFEAKKDEGRMVAEIKLGLSDPRVAAKYKIPLITEKIRTSESNTSLKQQIPLFFDLLEKTHPNESEVFYARGHHYFKTGFYPEASAALSKCIELGNHSEEIYSLIIQADYKAKNYEQLVKHAVDGISEHPHLPFFYYYASVAYTRLGDFNSSMQVARDGIEISVFQPLVTQQLLKALGNAAFQKKDYRLTDSAYEAAYLIDSLDMTLCNNLANLLALENRDLERAALLSKRALDRLPENPSYSDTYGYVLYRQGRYSLAESFFKSAVDAEPDNGLFLEHLGDNYYKQGKKSDAFMYWKKAQEKSGKSPELERKIREQKIIEP